MYERMLNRQAVPTVEEMTAYCSENAERFSMINDWLTTMFHTDQKVVFPYGNKYGWGIGHYKKKKLICNIFAEDGAFTVMMRLTDAQYAAVYGELKNTPKNTLIINILVAMAAGYIIGFSAKNIMKISRNCWR